MTSNFFQGGGPLGKNPLELDPQSQRIQQLLMQGQGQPPPAPPQTQFTPQEQPIPQAVAASMTGAQREQVQKARDAPIRGMDAIMSASTPTAGTALAKALAAGLAGHMGGKRNLEKSEKLEETYTEEAVKLAEKEDRATGNADRRLALLEQAEARLQGSSDQSAKLAERVQDWREDPNLTKAEKAKFRLQEQTLQLNAYKAELSSRANKGLKPTGEAMGKHLLGQRLDTQFGDASGTLKSMTPAQLGQVNDQFFDIANTALNNYGPEGMSRALEGKIQDPVVRDYFVKMAKIESDFSRMMSGMAVTVFEMKDRKNWSPNAPGISLQERMMRMENLRHLTATENNDFRQIYAGHLVEQGSVAPAAPQFDTQFQAGDMQGGPQPQITQPPPMQQPPPPPPPPGAAPVDLTDPATSDAAFSQWQAQQEARNVQGPSAPQGIDPTQWAGLTDAQKQHVLKKLRGGP